MCQEPHLCNHLAGGRVCVHVHLLETRDAILNYYKSETDRETKRLIERGKSSHQRRESL